MSQVCSGDVLGRGGREGDLGLLGWQVVDSSKVWHNVRGRGELRILFSGPQAIGAIPNQSIDVCINVDLVRSFLMNLCRELSVALFLTFITPVLLTSKQFNLQV